MSDHLPGNFSPLSQSELQRFEQRVNPRRESSLREVLFHGDSHIWFLNTVGNVDPLRTPRARFAYLLGRTFANIASVNILTPETVDQLKQIGIRQASEDCFIVREASSYANDELVWKQLDRAIAAELVFSLWIRRRDVHNENHAYNSEGVPTFFDFDVAFLSEHESEKVDEFFTRSDRGYAGSWKVFEVSLDNLPITNEYSRSLGQQSSRLPIANKYEFENHCLRIAEMLAADDRNLDALAKESKMASCERDRIVPFLTLARSAIKGEVELLLDRLRSK